MCCVGMRRRRGPPSRQSQTSGRCLCHRDGLCWNAQAARAADAPEPEPHDEDAAVDEADLEAAASKAMRVRPLASFWDLGFTLWLLLPTNLLQCAAAAGQSRCLRPTSKTATDPAAGAGTCRLHCPMCVHTMHPHNPHKSDVAAVAWTQKTQLVEER